MNGVIIELAPTDKKPGFYGKTEFGVGALTLGSIPKVLLLVGLACNLSVRPVSDQYYLKEQPAT